MVERKNIILALGNKEFNNSLIELKEFLTFNLEISDDIPGEQVLDKYQGILIHEDLFKKRKNDPFINSKINKIILYKSKLPKQIDHIEQLKLPVKLNQINKVVLDNIVKSEFKINSSLQIKDYKLDKNKRRLIKNDKFIELTEKEIELIELLNEKKYTKKKEILSSVWRYSDDVDTHTVETHIYRLRKKIKEIFNDESFLKSEKKGYTI